MSDFNEFIERRIIIGLIVSTEFIQRIYSIFNYDLVESNHAKLLAKWCFEYYDAYQKAPGHEIEHIYVDKLKAGLDDGIAEFIQQILGSVEPDLEREQFNVEYLVDETKQHFAEVCLRNHIEQLKLLLATNKITEAEAAALSYTHPVPAQNDAINIFDGSKETKQRVEEAFAEREAPLIRFPKTFGEFINPELVCDGFVAFMGHEKIGKTYMLMETVITALRSGCNVAFFQAGDMSEKQMIRRVGIYMNQRSDEERYCKELFVPTKDCVHNQTNTCTEPVRECGFGVFSEPRQLNNYNELTKAYHKNPDYKPCHNCAKFRGAAWLQKRGPVHRLSGRDCNISFLEFKRRYEPQFRMKTYPTETLTVAEMKAQLKIFERQENFVPDVIVVDYADILAPDPDVARLDFRQQQNKIWGRLRTLSMDRHCLVITVTQCNTKGYNQEWLTLANFSEDKRKNGLVTALYGLNQTEEEKRVGVLRVNEILARESNNDTPVVLLQRLQMGRPLLGSYYFENFV